MSMDKENKHFLSMLANNKGIIYKVANSYCKNVEDRNDLIQEITINLWKSWSKYNDKFKVSTWMYKIALNVAISFYRKTYQRDSFNLENYKEFIFIDEGEDIELSDNIKQLYYYIAKLDELNKALILLYLDQYSYEDIASTLGISKTNVATKISRIKNQLKKNFQ
ncbi:MAG: RNA polymerase subunit sigma-70 [Bacteroidetes bacterium 4572_117]|nr:MAG: RNA polymerase subunit sigma-70 [Bacteroidetes bacterium 4572_117]